MRAAECLDANMCAEALCFLPSKLNHPNVVDFYGACMKAPNLCFVMELCEMSLFTMLHRTTYELGPKRLTNMLV